MKKIEIKNQSGYIALIALLIVAVVGLTIGLAVSLRGIEEIQISHAAKEAAKAKILANSCIEEGLYRLRNSWVNYSGSLPFGSNSCIIEAVLSGSTATLTAVGTVDIYVQRIQVQIDNNLEVLNWQEY